MIELAKISSKQIALSITKSLQAKELQINI